MVLRYTCFFGIGQAIGDSLCGRQVGICMFLPAAGHQKTSIFHTDFESMTLQEVGWLTQTYLGRYTKVPTCCMLEGQRSVGRGDLPDIPSKSW